MRTFFTKTRVIVLFLLLVTVVVTLYLIQKEGSRTPSWITDAVTRGEVSQIVSVSGVVKAENAASLAFPASGIVTDIFVKEGDAVTTGQVLAALEQSALRAEQQDALGALRIAEANRSELIAGPRGEARNLTDINVAIARENLERIKREEAERVGGAYRTLLSSDLEALPVANDNDNTPPTVSGTFTCNTEGAYTLSIYRSRSPSGFSYRLTGLETGTYVAYTESPAPLGGCGLRIQFDSQTAYSEKDWRIEVPNSRGPRFAANISAYTLARQQERNAVEAAEQALEKALHEQTLSNATPRDEELARANAIVLQAEARLAQVNARIMDRTLRAPFPGTISKVDMVRGETVGAAPVMTMVADDNFKLIVRVPEIDITKLAVGLRAEIVFDARQNETIHGTITFIAPLAIIIDGVAYFEATILFDESPAWLRGGLNADVDIIVDRKTDTLRIPRRYLIERDGAWSVLIPQGTKATNTPVEVGFVGNDGFVEITGLSEGDTVIAP